MLYERRNGNFVLQLTGHPNYGLPFGQDRIVPIYLATLAVRQKSQTIRFRTAADSDISRIAMTTKSQTTQNRDGKGLDDTRRPVWLEATESFYKKRNRIAKECELSRYEALRRGLDALLRETQVRNFALNRNIKSPSQSELFRRTMGQVSRNYWAMVSAEERRERARKSAQARWSR
jgi:hypothetical protein